MLSSKTMMAVNAYHPPTVVQTGVSATTIADPQAGDVVVYLHGSLTNSDTHLVAGFTSIARKISDVLWGSGPTHYVQGHLQYRILTGAETQFTAGSGDGAWVQYRMTGPITSVTLSQTLALNDSMSQNYIAITQTEQTLGCIRVVGTGGTSPASTVQTLSTGETQTEVTSARSKFKSTHTFDAGSATSTRGGYSSPTFYSTLICNG